MNAYMRREEMRWTALSAAALVACMGAAVARLVTVQGPLIPDPAARASAKAADERLAQMHTCQVAAERLKSELDVYKATAKAARLAPSATPEVAHAGDATHAATHRPNPKDKDKGPDAELAWKSAMPAYRQARTLAPCRPTVEGVAGARPEAAPAWDAVAAVASLSAPAADDKPGMIVAARQVFALTEAPVGALVDTTRDAETSLKAVATREHERAQTALKQEPPLNGLLGRGISISVGLAIAVVALALSVASVRAAAIRRMVTLGAVRDPMRAATPGMHAAEILRLAAQHNGGEPGLVLGAALGGATAGLAWPQDPDVFVAGVMGGLVVGLAAQALLRLAIGVSAWRRRAMALGDYEKPSIPIVLVLNGVSNGLEARFIRFLSALAPVDAAATVERLAADVEARILASADAAAPPAGGSIPAHAPTPPTGMPVAPGLHGGLVAPNFSAPPNAAVSPYSPMPPPGYGAPHGAPPFAHPPGFGGTPPPAFAAPPHPGYAPHPFPPGPVPAGFAPPPPGQAPPPGFAPPRDPGAPPPPRALPPIPFPTVGPATPLPPPAPGTPRPSGGGFSNR